MALYRPRPAIETPIERVFRKIVRRQMTKANAAISTSVPYHASALLPLAMPPARLNSAPGLLY
jgi:hypothetical protein